MVENGGVQRELGSLDQRVKRLEEVNRDQTVVLNELRDMMLAARGSWKAVMGIAGVAAALGAVAAKLAAFLLPALPK